MQFKEFGLILFVENYESCVTFYKEKMQLPVRNVKGTLVTFDLPHGYLMVEQGGRGSESEKTRQSNPTVLRFDVDDLPSAVNVLKERGVLFLHTEIGFDWGKIAVFTDPDGNRLEIGEVNETSGSFKERRGEQ